MNISGKVTYESTDKANKAKTTPNASSTHTNAKTKGSKNQPVKSKITTSNNIKNIFCVIASTIYPLMTELLFALRMDHYELFQMIGTWDTHHKNRRASVHHFVVLLTLTRNKTGTSKYTVVALRA